MGPSGGHRQRSFMTFYDRPADRQPHAHTLGLCRKERVEDAVQVLRIDPCSGVFHGNQHTIEFGYFDLQIDSPMPIPWDFVVKNASKMRSKFCGSIPVPESSTVISTPLSLGTSLFIRRTRARFSTALIASMALTIKFTSTCRT